MSKVGIDGTVLAGAKGSQKVESLRVRHLEHLTPTNESEVLVVPMTAYDLILGIPWLNTSNPDIDWKRKEVLAVRFNGHGIDQPGDPTRASARKASHSNGLGDDIKQGSCVG